MNPAHDWYRGLEWTAADIARRAHAGQTTKSQQEPFINHPSRVAALSSKYAKPIAWLHDVLEDTDVTATMLLQQGIPESYVQSVATVTRREGEETYAEFIERIARSGNPLAIEVKLADLRDNLRLGCPKTLLERYLAAVRVLHTLPETLSRDGGTAYTE